MRLCRRKDIKIALSQRHRESKDARLYVIATSNGLKNTRICIAASKKLGNAVARNKVKRRLKQAFIQIRPLIETCSFDFVVYPRKEAMNCNYSGIKASLDRCLAKVL